MSTNQTEPGSAEMKKTTTAKTRTMSIVNQDEEMLTEDDLRQRLDSKEEMIQELVNKVNSLTLDKNRLRHRLTQKSQQSSAIQRNMNGTGSHSSTSLGSNEHMSEVQQGSDHQKSHQSPTSSFSELNSPVIDGIDCATSCEEDLVSLVALYRNRLLEYQKVTEYVTSKCVVFQLELEALRKHYGYAQQEIIDLKLQLDEKNGECRDIKSELQTVVLNYESQLSTMSEHVSCLTVKVASQSDELERFKLNSKIR